MQPLGLFGGAFDPIHVGHLRTAFELWQELRLAEVRFIPTGNPPHREQLNAPAELRVAMVKAAVADQPAFVVDDREVRRTGTARCVCCWVWMLFSVCRTGTGGVSCSGLRTSSSRIGPGGRPPRADRWARSWWTTARDPFESSTRSLLDACTFTPGHSSRFPRPSCVNCSLRGATPFISYRTGSDRSSARRGAMLPVDRADRRTYSLETGAHT
jgi:hypothetical protein